MNISNSKYNIVINDKDGTLEEYSNIRRDYIRNGFEKKPLFTIRFRELAGKITDISACDECAFTLNKNITSEGIQVELSYEQLAGLPINILVSIGCPFESCFSYWNLSVEHDTELYIEWIDFPHVVVPNDLIGAGGDSRLVWPVFEGVLIENADVRNNTWLKYEPISYPSKGCQGYYPAACHTQFMAYYGSLGGLYMGAHDEQCNVKTLEYYNYGDGIKLEFKLFPGGITRGRYKMQYDMVLGVFEGDWYEAADIYRSWYEDSKVNKPLKLFANKELPLWMDESPVIVTYPVRGTGDTGDMSVNEYFPYSNAIPYLDRLSEGFDSKIMALLMHWEGTAPWAPPYVWPPFGGEDIFKEFIDRAHEKGWLVGVYGSGIGWTNESYLVPEYTEIAQKKYLEQNLQEVMCESPEGEIGISRLIGYPIRSGYDMCPACDFVGDTVACEVEKIVASGCDYIQYFDQNLGGGPCICYSKKHGHPFAPGKWENEAMINVFKKLQHEIRKQGSKVIIGCENSASEPFMTYLQFNDLRYEVAYNVGVPIPLYSYIYHEYVNNFMGNQCWVFNCFDLEKSEENLQFRLAYSFTAGDMMTVVLGDGGKLIWGWCMDWNAIKPDQNAAIQLVKNLNTWRIFNAKPFLRYGRMERPYSLIYEYDREFTMNQIGKMSVPSLITSRWRAPNGRNAQIVVNYTNCKQCFSLRPYKYDFRWMIVYSDAKKEEATRYGVDKLGMELEIEPLSAVLLEFI